MPAPDIKIVETTVDNIIANLDSPTSNLGRSKEHHIISDVGATNCRIGIVAKGVDGMHEIFFVSRKANSVPELRAVYEAFVKEVTPRRLAKVAAASVNVPAPASGMVGGPLANYKGATLKDRFIDYRLMPHELFPLENTIVMNDLEACAHGIVATSKLDTFSTAFTPLWQAKSPPHAPYDGTLGCGNCVVVAPGTGLGVAAIQYHHHDDKYTVFPLEFGHTNIAYMTTTAADQSNSNNNNTAAATTTSAFVADPTSTAATTAFLNDYAKDNYKGKNTCEYDDLCAGRGLERAYRFLAAAAATTTAKNSGPSAASTASTTATAIVTAAPTTCAEDLKAPEISKRAAAGDKLATGAMRLYNKVIMNFCSQMAMGFQPKTIVLCGDNAVKNSFFYSSEANVAEMKGAYMEHSMERYGFMSKVHLLRQTKLMNLNLLGCAYVCETMKLHKKSKL